MNTELYVVEINTDRGKPLGRTSGTLQLIEAVRLVAVDTTSVDEAAEAAAAGTGRVLSDSNEPMDLDALLEESMAMQTDRAK